MISGLNISNIGIFIVFGSFVVSLLPVSPFDAFISALGEYPYLSTVNWFVPITEILALLQAWLAAVSAYILISLVARWIKLVS